MSPIVCICESWCVEPRHDGVERVVDLATFQRRHAKRSPAARGLGAQPCSVDRDLYLPVFMHHRPVTVGGIWIRWMTAVCSIVSA